MWMMLQSRLSFLDATYDTLPSPINLYQCYGSEEENCQICSTPNPSLQHILFITIRSCRNWRTSEKHTGWSWSISLDKEQGSEHLLEGEITNTWGWTEPKSRPWLAAQVPNRDHHLSASRHHPVVHLSPNSDHDGARCPLGGRKGVSLRKEEWQVHGGVSWV